ncbi:ATP-binding protein [Ferrovibrio xuzhouensis]|uniref:histidine kinase n=1 Tax=Ferrovibrio xuzhouensis TaxID=1576914 RepID=A0ABV7V963_9PROT
MTDDTRRTIDRYAVVGARERVRAGWQTWVDRLQRLLTLFADDSGSGAGIHTVPDPDVTNRRNMALLIQLRSIAIVGQVVTIVVVEAWLGVALPLAQMALVLLALITLNIATGVWLRLRRAVTGRALLLVLVFDVAALSVQLWLSGGAVNPFISLFLLQVTLGAVLLDALSTWIIVVLACLSVVGLTFWHRPLALPDPSIGDMFSLHLTGMLACFLLDAVLLVVFVTRVSRNLRERDAHVAAMRQHAAEENHIVRMGLLASGAAHELGTPLSSLSVILGDWRRMPAVVGDTEMAQELEEMQAAVRRCKAIVTGILLSAGQTRGEASEATTLNAFIEGIVLEWRGLRATAGFALENGIHDAELPVASDAVIRQAIFNVLDNAFEASPQNVRLTVDQDRDMLVLRVYDAGPGFDPAMLSQIGKPYQSSKGRAGGGLGLFLVVNVVRKLGGSVAARNLPQGGAVVMLTLPLAALKIPEGQHA